MLTLLVLLAHFIKLCKNYRAFAAAIANEYVEGVVCKASDIGENEMKECPLSDAGKVLLVRQNGKLTAIGALCPHYDAPLISAALGNGKIRCQRHGACFDLNTGDIEDFPTFDALPCFEVTVHNNEVSVRAKRTEVRTSRRTKRMVKCDQGNDRRVVIVGGGPSGAICAETLRQEGYTGKITLVCKENHLPYDRVLVNKRLDFDIEGAQFRNDTFYCENDIDVLRGVHAVGVCTSENRVSLSDGSDLEYDYLYIATGLEAVKVPIPGNDLRNVVVLRDYEHTKYLNAQLTADTEVVILGAGFVGMEVASSVSRTVRKVTVIGRDSLPFKAILGPRVAQAVLDLFKRKNVNMLMNSGVTRIIGNTSKSVQGVQLLDGTILKADICIMAVGSRCNTSFLQNSGIKTLPTGAIDVDERLRTSVPNVYAGGDIAHAPVWTLNGRKMTITHFGLAHYHGKIAGLNISGRVSELRTVPFFWTKFFGYGIPYAGYWEYDDVLYHGDVEALEFVAFYLKGDDVVAVSSCKNHPYVASFAEVLAEGRKLVRADLEGDMLAWAKVRKVV